MSKKESFKDRYGLDQNDNQNQQDQSAPSVSLNEQLIQAQLQRQQEIDKTADKKYNKDKSKFEEKQDQYKGVRKRLNKIPGFNKIDMGMGYYRTIGKSVASHGEMGAQISEAMMGGYGVAATGAFKGVSNTRKLAQQERDNSVKKELGVAGRLGQANRIRSYAGRSLLAANTLGTLASGGAGHAMSSNVFSALGITNPAVLAGTIGLSLGSSILKNKKLKKITANKKSPFQEEKKYALSTPMEQFITQLTAQNELDSAQQMQTRLLMYIESHTSLVPLIHTELEYLRQEKEKGVKGTGQNYTNTILDKSANETSTLDKIETGFSSLITKFDPFTQLTNFLLMGKTPSQMLKDIRGDEDSKKEDNKISESLGISSNEARLLQLTSQDLVSKGKSYEEKMFLLASGQFDISRLLARETITMRKGMGIDQTAFNVNNIDSKQSIFSKALQTITDIPGLSAVFNAAKTMWNMPDLMFKGAKSVANWGKEKLFGKEYLELQDDETVKKKLGLYKSKEDSWKEFIGEGLPQKLEDLRVIEVEQLEAQQNIYNVSKSAYELLHEYITGQQTEVEYKETQQDNKQRTFWDKIEQRYLSADATERAVKGRQEQIADARAESLKGSLFNTSQNVKDFFKLITKGEKYSTLYERKDKADELHNKILSSNTALFDVRRKKELIDVKDNETGLTRDSKEELAKVYKDKDSIHEYDQERHRKFVTDDLIGTRFKEGLEDFKENALPRVLQGIMLAGTGGLGGIALSTIGGALGFSNKVKKENQRLQEDIEYTSSRDDKYKVQKINGFDEFNQLTSSSNIIDELTNNSSADIKSTRVEKTDITDINNSISRLINIVEDRKYDSEQRSQSLLDINFDLKSIIAPKIDTAIDILSNIYNKISNKEEPRQPEIQGISGSYNVESVLSNISDSYSQISDNSQDSVNSNIIQLFNDREQEQQDTNIRNVVGFATGGNVDKSNDPIVVGENGPEIFIPNISGEVQNNTLFSSFIESIKGYTEALFKSSSRVINVIEKQSKDKSKDTKVVSDSVIKLVDYQKEQESKLEFVFSEVANSDTISSTNINDQSTKNKSDTNNILPFTPNKDDTQLFLDKVKNSMFGIKESKIKDKSLIKNIKKELSKTSKDNKNSNKEVSLLDKINSKIDLFYNNAKYERENNLQDKLYELIAEREKLNKSPEEKDQLSAAITQLQKKLNKLSFGSPQEVEKHGMVAQLKDAEEEKKEQKESIFRSKILEITTGISKGISKFKGLLSKGKDKASELFDKGIGALLSMLKFILPGALFALPFVSGGKIGTKLVAKQIHKMALKYGSKIVKGITSIFGDNILERVSGVATKASGWIAKQLPESLLKSVKGLGYKIINTFSSSIGKIAGKGGGKLAAKFSGGTIAKLFSGMGHGLLKAIGLGKLFGKSAGKMTGKVLAKSGLKKIPFLGALVGVGFGVKRLMEGDVIGAVGEIASGLTSLIPGLGIPLGLAIDGWLAFRDMGKDQKDEVDPTQKPKKSIWKQFKSWIGESFKKLIMATPIVGGIIGAFMEFKEGNKDVIKAQVANDGKELSIWQKIGIWSKRAGYIALRMIPFVGNFIADWMQSDKEPTEEEIAKQANVEDTNKDAAKNVSSESLWSKIKKWASYTFDAVMSDIPFFGGLYRSLKDTGKIQERIAEDERLLGRDLSIWEKIKLYATNTFDNVISSIPFLGGIYTAIRDNVKLINEDHAIDPNVSKLTLFKERATSIFQDMLVGALRSVPFIGDPIANFVLGIKDDLQQAKLDSPNKSWGQVLLTYIKDSAVNILRSVPVVGDFLANLITGDKAKQVKEQLASQGVNLTEQDSKVLQYGPVIDWMYNASLVPDFAANQVAKLFTGMKGEEYKKSRVKLATITGENLPEYADEVKFDGEDLNQMQEQGIDYRAVEATATRSDKIVKAQKLKEESSDAVYSMIKDDPDKLAKLKEQGLVEDTKFGLGTHYDITDKGKMSMMSNNLNMDQLAKLEEQGLVKDTSWIGSADNPDDYELTDAGKEYFKKNKSKFVSKASKESEAAISAEMHSPLQKQWMNRKRRDMAGLMTDNVFDYIQGNKDLLPELEKQGLVEVDSDVGYKLTKEGKRQFDAIQAQKNVGPSLSDKLSNKYNETSQKVHDYVQDKKNKVSNTYRDVKDSLSNVDLSATNVIKFPSKPTQRRKKNTQSAVDMSIPDFDTALEDTSEFDNTLEDNQSYDNFLDTSVANVAISTPPATKKSKPTQRRKKNTQSAVDMSIPDFDTALEDTSEFDNALEDTQSYDDFLDTSVADVTPVKRSSKLEGIIKTHIMNNEGVRLSAYKDSKGLPTIGVGHLITKNDPDLEKVTGSPNTRKLTGIQAIKLFNLDYMDHKKQAETLPVFSKLDPVRQGVLTDMTFNMGLNKLKGFKKMLGALDAGNAHKAYYELLNSQYAREVGYRARRNAELMYSGDPSLFRTDSPQIIAKNGAWYTGSDPIIDAQLHTNEVVAPIDRVGKEFFKAAMANKDFVQKIVEVEDIKTRSEGQTIVPNISKQEYEVNTDEILKSKMDTYKKELKEDNEKQINQLNSVIANVASTVSKQPQQSQVPQSVTTPISKSNISDDLNDMIDRLFTSCLNSYDKSFKEFPFNSNISTGFF